MTAKRYETAILFEPELPEDARKEFLVDPCSRCRRRAAHSTARGCGRLACSRGAYATGVAWSAERLKAYRDSFKELKGNKQVCETTVAMTQNMLLADRAGMDDILEAIRKVQKHSAELAKAA